MDSYNSKYQKILFITSGYPTEDNPIYTFLDSLVCAVANKGIECTVIYPVSITHALAHKKKLPPYEWIRKTDENSLIRVFCPRIITVSSKDFLNSLRVWVNYLMCRYAALHVIKKNKLLFDVVYGHFISPAGFIAALVGKIKGVPSCLAYGENTSYTVDRFGSKKTAHMLNDITAVVSVATDNTRYLRDNRLVPKERIKTIPNAIDPKIFYPHDKRAMREKYGIIQDAFVVAFLGFFSDIKGSLRLSEAINHLEGIHSIFIGSGPLRPSCNNILFEGKLPHHQVPEMLSAADVFVLPTIAEGCCNAIIEAMACGLPVISSNLPFNDDILNDNCAIRVDSTDIGEIASAINQLRKDEEMRRKMSKASIERAKELNINARAQNILDWIEQCENNFLHKIEQVG